MVAHCLYASLAVWAIEDHAVACVCNDAVVLAKLIACRVWDDHEHGHQKKEPSNRKYPLILSHLISWRAAEKYPWRHYLNDMNLPSRLTVTGQGKLSVRRLAPTIVRSWRNQMKLTPLLTLCSIPSPLSSTLSSTLSGGSAVSRETSKQLVLHWKNWIVKAVISMSDRATKQL